MFTKRIIFIILILLGPIATCSFASLLLDITDYNARLYGSGEALLVENNDLNNLEIFPSSLAAIRANEISMGYFNWAQMASFVRLAYGRRIGDSDVLGISVNYAGFKGENNYDETGTLLGALNSKDVGINVGYALSLNPSFNVGLNLQYLNMAIENYTGEWLGLSLSGIMGVKLPCIGVLAKDNFFFGVGVQNIGILQAQFDQEQSNYPIHIRPGFTWDIAQISDLIVKIGSSLDYMTVYNQGYVNAGMELGWHDLLFLRTGFSFMSRNSVNTLLV